MSGACAEGNDPGTRQKQDHCTGDQLGRHAGSREPCSDGVRHFLQQSAARPFLHTRTATSHGPSNLMAGRTSVLSGNAALTIERVELFFDSVWLHRCLSTGLQAHIITQCSLLATLWLMALCGLRWRRSLALPETGELWSGMHQCEWPPRAPPTLLRRVCWQRNGPRATSDCAEGY